MEKGYDYRVDCAAKKIRELGVDIRILPDLIHTSSVESRLMLQQGPSIQSTSLSEILSMSWNKISAKDFAMGE